MSVDSARVEFMCDHPGCGVLWNVVARNMTKVRIKLREDGWTVVGSKDYCPNHRPKTTPTDLPSKGTPP